MYSQSTGFINNKLYKVYKYTASYHISHVWNVSIFILSSFHTKDKEYVPFYLSSHDKIVYHAENLTNIVSKIIQFVVMNLCKTTQ